MQKLWVDSKLHSQKTNGRKSQFVIVPGTPNVKDFSDDDKRLIAFGESTIKHLLTDKKHKNHVLPRVLFLADPEKDQDKCLNEHFLSTYVSAIQNEKQLPIEFHIASHGDPNRVFYESIGLIDLNNGIKVAGLAKKLSQLFKACDPENKVKFLERELHFTFHTCNSAYCDITLEMNDEEKKRQILAQTLIGKFSQYMKEYGFKNITVHGFRGYYQHLYKGNGAFVSNCTTPKGQTFYTADNARFTIHSDGKIDIPQNACFNVDIPCESEEVTWKEVKSQVGKNKSEKKYPKFASGKGWNNNNIQSCKNSATTPSIHPHAH